MDLDYIMKTRKMTRRFKDTPLEDSVIEELLKSVRFSPSAGHAQGFRFLVLTDFFARIKFFEITCDKEWLNTDKAKQLIKAPVIIIPFALKRSYIDRYNQQDKLNSHMNRNFMESQSTPFWITDLAFAVMLLLLKAQDLSLGALFFAIHNNEHDLKEQFGIPSDADLIGTLAVGYKNETQYRKPRKSLGINDLIKFNTWK